MNGTVAQCLGSDGLFRLSGYQTAVGWVAGFDPPLTPNPGVASGNARAAFEQAVLNGLRKPPCIIAFSGGRDSSAVLAVAKHLADREGLDPPIAGTHVFTDDPGSDESSWQETVIGHLGVADWQRVEAEDNFDILGGPAQRGMRKHGQLFPAMVYAHWPLFGLANGGTLLTGDGGDEILGSQRVTPLLLAARRRPSRATARTAIGVLAPLPVRRAIVARRHKQWSARPWLRPAVAERFTRDLIADDTSEPLRWDAAVRRRIRQRGPMSAMHNMKVIAREEGAEIIQPFLDPMFVNSLAAKGGRVGFSGRSEIMGMLFADVLPPELLDRQTKAYFNGVVVGAASRAFIKRWSGAGLDPELVDAEALREEWQRPLPHAGTNCLLQAAWLAEEGSSRPVGEMVDPAPL